MPPIDFCISKNTLIHNNIAFKGGGIFFERSYNQVLDNVSIINNIADQFGGGIHCDGANSQSTITINNSNIQSNTSNNGGGISIYFMTSTITNTQINDNTSNSGFTRIPAIEIIEE